MGLKDKLKDSVMKIGTYGASLYVWATAQSQLNAFLLGGAVLTIGLLCLKRSSDGASDRDRVDSSGKRSG